MTWYLLTAGAELREVAEPDRCCPVSSQHGIFTGISPGHLGTG